MERSDDARARAGFSAAIQRSKTAHKFGWAVDDRGQAFYQDPKTKIFLTKNETAGAAVAPDGEVTSAFRSPGSPHTIDEILTPAMAAGNHATCFDTNGYLPNLYAKYGYRPVARVAFDPKLAPEGWTPEAGTPDVLFLVRDPDGVSGGPDIHGDYLKHKDEIPLVAYEIAVNRQKRAMSKVRYADMDSEKGLNTTEKGWLRDHKAKQKQFEKETGKLGMRFDAELTGERTPLKSLTDYLSMQANYQRGNLDRLKKTGGNDEGWKYGGTGDYLMSEGKEFDVPSEPPQIKLGTPKECYSNSANTMLDSGGGKYDYAEGLYISPHLPFPIEHAWLVDKATGTVVDPTLGWQPKARYFGVQYPKVFVIKKMLQHKYYGIHSGGEMGNDIVFGIDKDYKGYKYAKG